MKKIILTLISIAIVVGFVGCASKNAIYLDEDVAVEKGYINHYTSPYYEVNTGKDIEDLIVYMPKNTTTMRIKMQVANLEDIIYMKLVTEDGYEIDKILRRVGDIKELGYEQDGYMYEPSIEKNVVTLQVYVPSIYIFKGAYKPKLIFSFKRNSRSVQESVQFYFLRDVYSVGKDANGNESPKYSTLEELCKETKKADEEFFTQIVQVNENRIDLETIKDIQNLCK